MTVLLALLFGFLHGLRHAFEPDHVVAISTVIAEQRGARARVAYAASWGLGHALTLVSFGAIVMLARAEVPERLDAAFETAVCLMLVGLGARALHRAAVGLRGPRREARPSSLHPAGRGHAGAGAVAMGVVHGLAGSGGLTALVVARMPSVTSGIVVLVVFGAGAAFGMALLAGALGAPLASVMRTRWGTAGMLCATGCASLLLGLVWMAPAVARMVAAR
jgi:nickel/cobalt exporter